MKKKIIIAIAIFFLVGMGLTSLYAKDIGYHYLLGKPLFMLEGYPIYSLFTFFNINQGLKMKSIVTYTKYLKLIKLSIPVIFFCVMYKKQTSIIHGSAKWASMSEIKEMNIIHQKKIGGVILGKFQGKYLSHNGAEHIMMMAPTRMGKGINTVLPTLYSWPDSVVVNDIKGECWGKTSGFRKEVLGQEVIMFNPVSKEPTWTYNPLDFIKLRTDDELEDTKIIAQTLIDTSGKGETDHWATGAIILLTAAILHVKYIKESASLSDVIFFLTDPESELVERMGAIVGKFKDDDGNTQSSPPFCHSETNDLFNDIYQIETRTHPIVASVFAQMFSTPPNERGSIESSCKVKLEIFKDPKIKRNTASSSFTMADLKGKRISLYLVTPPKAIEMTKPLIRLIFTQAISELTGIMKFDNENNNLSLEKRIEKSMADLKDKVKDTFVIPKGKNRLLFLIDEFPSLGKLEIFEKALPYIAGYGLKSLLITQSMNQLLHIYGDKTSILENCGVQIYLTPGDSKTPKMISEMLGTYTEKARSKSGKNGVLLDSSYTESLISRPLMTAGEVRVLAFKKVLLFVAGQNPILCDKIFYFKDRLFKRCENYNIPKYITEVKENGKENSLDTRTGISSDQREDHNREEEREGS